MKNDRMIEKYRDKLVKEAIVSSLGYGLIGGALVNFLTACVCWLFGYNGLWLCIGLGIGTFLLSAVLLYFFKFRPTEQGVLRRIDAMGLEERIVTMKELEQDDSYIARLQREDARQKESEVTSEQVKAAFPVFTWKAAAIACLVVSVLAGAGMTTVVGLTSAGVIPSPGLIDPDNPRDLPLAVSYLVEGGGEIEFLSEQLIEKGDDAEPVVAVAEDGWTFVEWSDGRKSPDRADKKIMEDLTVTARFEEVPDGGEDGDGDPSGEEGEGDGANDIPDASGGAGEGGSDGEGGEGNGNGGSGEGNGSGEGGQEGEGNGNGKGDGAGGGWSDGNQVIDGNTDYREILQIYYDMAMEILESGGELPPELKEFIEKYYGSL